VINTVIDGICSSLFTKEMLMPANSAGDGFGWRLPGNGKTGVGTP